MLYLIGTASSRAETGSTKARHWEFKVDFGIYAFS